MASATREIPAPPERPEQPEKIVLYLVRDASTGTRSWSIPVWFDDREEAFGWWLDLGIAGIDAVVGQVEVSPTPTAKELCALLAGSFHEETIASAERKDR